VQTKLGGGSLVLRGGLEHKRTLPVISEKKKQKKKLEDAESALLVLVLVNNIDSKRGKGTDFYKDEIRRANRYLADSRAIVLMSSKKKARRVTKMED